MHRFSILSERGMVFNRVPKMLLTGAQIYKTILKHCPIHAISQTLSKRLRGSFKETASNSTNVKRKKNKCMRIANIAGLPQPQRRWSGPSTLLASFRARHAVAHWEPHVTQLGFKNPMRNFSPKIWLTFPQPSDQAIKYARKAQG